MSVWEFFKLYIEMKPVDSPICEPPSNRNISWVSVLPEQNNREDETTLQRT
jgi:hypothetical protein